VPLAQINAVSDALIARLHKVTVGDPAQEGVKMGALVNHEQRQDVQESVNKLIAAGCEALLGGQADLSAAGAFFPPTLLYCPQPDETPAVHAIEAFGPVATLMPYRDRQHALTLARAGGGSLAGTLVTASGELAREFILGAARAWPYSDPERSILRRVNRPRFAAAAAGARRPRPRWRRRRAGGLRSVKHYMQRTAVQGSPTMLATIGQQWVRGAQVSEDRIHPFRKYFEEIQPGDSLLTPRRTLTEADIVNFACLSGDHFYAHMDKIAAAESIFGERVVHGYFLISAAAGLFVDAGVGPVIANYGMENLRFIEPVKPGDTIQVRLTCKRKTVKRQRSAEEKATGVVEWAVEIFNQHQQAVALYSILTLVARQQISGVMAENRPLALLADLEPLILQSVCNGFAPGSPLCYLWLQRTLRSRLIVCVMPHGAGSAQGAASRLYRLRPAKSLRGAFDFSLQGSGRGSVPAKHGPQPASILTSQQAASTGSFSAPAPAWVAGKASAATRQKIGARSQCLCGGIFYVRLAKLTNKLAKANKRPGAAGW
jgi:acyl dehydratase